jgi:NitT/TauT family transport system substrate-binding protein
MATSRRQRRSARAPLLLAIACAAVVAWADAATAADKVNVFLDFIQTGKHAGFYVAIEQGYFAAADLDVTVTAGRVAGASITNVVTGAAQFGVSDFPNLVLARAKGTPVRSIMVLHEQSPFAIAAIKERFDLRSPKSLEGLGVAVPAGSTMAAIMPVFLKLNATDPAKVRLVNMSPSLFISTLLRSEIEVIPAFTNEIGVVLRLEAAKAGKELSVLQMKDFGLDTYSMNLVTADRTIAQNPALVRRLVTAVTKGYAFMLAQPEEAARIMLKHLPELSPDIVRGQINATVPLLRSDRFTERGFGWADDRKLKHTIDVLEDAYGLQGKVAVKDVHTNEFLVRPATR